MYIIQPQTLLSDYPRNRCRGGVSINKTILVLVVLIASLGILPFTHAIDYNTISTDDGLYYITPVDFAIYYPEDINTTFGTSDFSTNNRNGDFSGLILPVYQNNCFDSGCYRFNEVMPNASLASKILVSNLTQNYNVFNNSFTVAVWVKLNTLRSGTNYIIGNEHNSVGSAGWELYINSASNLEVEFRNSTQGVGTSVALYPLELDEWQFVVLSYNKTSQQALLSLNNNTVSMGTPFSQNGYTSAITFRIGDFGIFSGNSTAWNGSMDDIMILTKAFSSDQISQLYAAQYSRFNQNGSIVYTNLNLSGVGNENAIRVELTEHERSKGVGTPSQIKIQVGTPSGSTYAYGNEYPVVDGVGIAPISSVGNVSVKINLYADQYRYYSPAIVGLPTISSVYSINSSLNYDANGNLIKDENYYYTYNTFNQLESVRIGNATGTLVTEYFYGPDGKRIKKNEYVGASNITTLYIGENTVQQKNGTSTINQTFYYQGKYLVAEKTDGVTSFYMPDALGSTDVVFDDDGDILSKTTYKPYGLQFGASDARYSFSAKELEITNLYDFDARKLNPTIAYFLQPDPQDAYPYEPMNLQRYSYALHNPYMYKDESGEVVDTFVDIAFIGLDIADIVKDPKNVWNYAALGADVAGALIPFATGGGLIIKGSIKVIDDADDISHIGKFFNRIDDAEQLSLKASKAVSDRSRLQHALNTAQDAKIEQFVGRGSSNNVLNEFAEFNKDIISNPDFVFKRTQTRGREAVTTYVREINGKYVLVDVFETGKYKGLVSTVTQTTQERYDNILKYRST